MIPFAAVADAIAGLIAAQWPERTIYRDVCPADFERPSFYLSCDSVNVEREMGLLSIQTTFLLEIFDEADEYYVTSTERLMAVQAGVLSLFAGTDLPVEDRHLTVETKAEGREPDKAFVSFVISWMDADDEKVPDLPLMDEFDFTMGRGRTPQSRRSRNSFPTEGSQGPAGDGTFRPQSGPAGPDSSLV